MLEKAVLEKTRRFLKKEFGKTEVANDDFFNAVMKEKTIISVFLSKILISYLITIMKPLHDDEKLRDRRNHTLEILTAGEPDALDPLNVERSWILTDTDNIEILKLFLETPYCPPKEVPDLIRHLLVVRNYYGCVLPSMGSHSWYTDSKIDLALLELTISALSMANSIDFSIAKKDQSSSATKGQKEKGRKNESTIRRIVDDLEIRSLQDFRGDKKLRERFIARAKKDTTLTAETTIFNLAREYIKNRDGALDTKTTV